MSFFTGVAMGSHKGRLFGHHLKPLPVFYGNCITEEVTLDISWRLTQVFGTPLIETTGNTTNKRTWHAIIQNHRFLITSHHLPSHWNLLEVQLHVGLWPGWIGSSSHTWCPNVWGVRQDENVVNLAYEIVTMKGEFWVSVSNCWESTDMGPSWWYEPKLKNISQIGPFPQVRVKVKTLWTHHLDMV